MLFRAVAASLAILSANPALGAPPAVPTKLYQATVLSVEQHSCVVSEIVSAGPQGAHSAVGTDTCHPPLALPIGNEYDTIIAKVLIANHYFYLVVDNMNYQPCAQISVSNVCRGGTVALPSVSGQTVASFAYVNRGAVYRMLDNVLYTHKPINIQIVQSSVSDPSLATELDTSNVRFIDDGVGDRFVVHVVGAFSGTPGWDDPTFPDYLK